MILASLSRASGLVISIFLSNVLVAMVFLLSIARHNTSTYIISQTLCFAIYFHAPQKRLPENRKPLIIHIITDYSMIEATLPDPTVRPPSRLSGIVIVFANRDKMGLSIFAVPVK